MHQFFKAHLQRASLGEDTIESLATLLAPVVATPEFAELYESRIRPRFDLGLGNQTNQSWSHLMTALQDAALAFATALKAAVNDNSSIDPAHIATLDSEVAALQANGETDEANIADLTAAVTTITGALAAAPQPAPQPSPAPTA